MDIPTALETTQVPSTLNAPGGLAVQVNPSIIAFGPVRPGDSSAPVELNITNTGLLPVRVRFEAAAMLDLNTGASMPRDAIFFGLASEGEFERPALTELLVAPGQPVSLRVVLNVPSGAQQWVPSGDYQGIVSLFLEEVTS